MSTASGPEPPETSQADAPSPSRWRRALVWGEWLLTAGLLVFVLYRLGPQLSALTGVGPSLGRAPELSFVTLDGDSVTSADLAGKVVVVNFWATWCLPCRLEMPSLEKLHRRHAGHDVAVVGLATDVGSADPIRDFLREEGITYPVGRATAAHKRAFGGIPGIPTTFLIDRSGVIRHKVVGYFAPPALGAAVNRLLEAGAPP